MNITAKVSFEGGGGVLKLRLSGLKCLSNSSCKHYVELSEHRSLSK